MPIDKIKYPSREGAEKHPGGGAAFVKREEKPWNFGGFTHIYSVERIEHTADGTGSSHPYIYKEFVYPKELALYVDKSGKPHSITPANIKAKITEAKQEAIAMAQREVRFARLIGLHPKEMVIQENGMPGFLMRQEIGTEVFSSDIWTKNNVPFRKCLDYFTTLAYAYLPIYKNNVIHCDLKPENFILNDQDPSGKMTVKIVDAGACRDKDENYSGGSCFTAEYVSPEQFFQDNLTYTTDIWALGRHGLELFSNIGMSDYISGDNILSFKGKRKSFDDKQRVMTKFQLAGIFKIFPQAADNYLVEQRLIKNILAACVSINPNDRPNPEEFANAFSIILNLHDTVNPKGILLFDGRMQTIMSYVDAESLLATKLSNLQSKLNELSQDKDKQAAYRDIYQLVLKFTKLLHGLFVIFDNNDCPLINAQKAELLDDLRQSINTLKSSLDKLGAIFLMDFEDEVFNFLNDKLLSQAPVVAVVEPVQEQIQVQAPAPVVNQVAQQVPEIVEVDNKTQINDFFNAAIKNANRCKQPELSTAIAILRGHVLSRFDTLSVQQLRLGAQRQETSPHYKQAQDKQKYLLELAQETAKVMETNIDKSTNTFHLKDKAKSVASLEKLADQWFSDDQEILHDVGRIISMFIPIALGIVGGAMIGAAAGSSIVGVGTAAGAVTGALVGGVVAAVASWKTGGLLFPNPATAVVKQMANAHNQGADNAIPKLASAASAA